MKVVRCVRRVKKRLHPACAHSIGIFYCILHFRFQYPSPFGVLHFKPLSHVELLLLPDLIVELQSGSF